MFVSLSLKDEKRYLQTVFTIVFYIQMKIRVLEYEQTRTELRFSKIVANEKCTAEIGDYEFS